MRELTAWEIDRMRDTVFAVQLDMKCTVQRRTTTVDAYEQPVTTLVDHLTDIPCHYWEESEKEVVGDANALVTQERIVFEANTDIADIDFITSVSGVDDTIVATNLNVIEVIKQINHVLAVIRGGR